ncbi:hypothetical protein LV779_14970 [Streptomyces thinghirensis]|nr:hypothetical protein [Streptomyces thinghirensis]
MTAMRAQALVEAELGRVLPVAALLGGASVMDVVDQVLDSRTGTEAADEPLAAGKGTSRGGFEPLVAPCADGTVRYPATRDVIRLLRTEQLGTPGVAHNIGSAVRLVTPVSRERLTGLLGNLSARHAALRTAIVADPEHGLQLEVGRSLPGTLLRWSPVDEDTDPDQRLRGLLEPPFELALLRCGGSGCWSTRRVVRYCSTARTTRCPICPRSRWWRRRSARTHR